MEGMFREQGGCLTIAEIGLRHCNGFFAWLRMTPSAAQGPRPIEEDREARRSGVCETASRAAEATLGGGEGRRAWECPPCREGVSEGDAD